MGPGFDARMMEYLRYVQCGVISRRQFLELGGTDNDLERLVRRRELNVVSPGVYVDHTGALTPRQREWATVLRYWPAALSHESAIPVLRSPTIQVAVGLRRNLQAAPGTAIHRMAQLTERVDWRAGPPRVRVNHALIDVMSARITTGDVAGAYSALTQTCHAHTRPDRVVRTLGQRERVAGRALIEGMLTDLRDGICSVLERGYARHVERPHGLPRPSRQRSSQATGDRTDKDVHYEKYGVIVELDGRAIHDHPDAWDSDARRDLAELATADVVTARVTYGLVFREPCTTAARIGMILRRHGWDGPFVRCPSCPPDLVVP